MAGNINLSVYFVIYSVREENNENCGLLTATRVGSLLCLEAAGCLVD